MNKKKGTLPSKEDAESAMEMIKVLQEKNDEELIKKKLIEEESEKQRLIAEAERIKIQLAQDRVKKVLRDNLKKKEINKNKNNIKKVLELATIKDSKIKWKSINNGHKLQGYVNDRLTFEILRGLTIFSLYIKDEKLQKEKKFPNYIGCSTNLQKLKHKSDNLLKLR